MPNPYRVKDQFAIYFLTFTVTQWIDVFTRKEYVEILVNSLRHCQVEKGLKIYAWVIMSNHLHLIVRSEKEPLSNIIRDYKKYTSKQIVRAIESNPKESRKNWMLWLFKEKPEVNPTIDEITFWRDGYHGEEIFSESFMKSKMDYIHDNPVKAGIVNNAEDYRNSSAITILTGQEGLLELSPI